MSYYAKSTAQFTYEAMKVHGDRYDYSEVKYIGTHMPVRIKCPQCGNVFLQEPSSHLAGHGCPKCNKKQTHRKISQEAYIARAKEVHGDKYDYSKTKYKDMRSKIEIVCPVHGSFYQQAQSHLLGHGCPLCKSDKQKERMKAMADVKA